MTNRLMCAILIFVNIGLGLLTHPFGETYARYARTLMKGRNKAGISGIQVRFSYEYTESFLQVSIFAHKKR